jgi:hypothetical protein
MFTGLHCTNRSIKEPYTVNSVVPDGMTVYKWRCEQDFEDPVAT